jgi:NAD(P) transhydrogenase
MNNHNDVIVIGTGPGGEGAAMKAAKEGKTVAVVEDKWDIGGNCTHRGTIPSKALRQAIEQLANQTDLRRIEYQDLLKLAESVVARQINMLRRRTGSSANLCQEIGRLYHQWESDMDVVQAYT